MRVARLPQRRHVKRGIPDGVAKTGSEALRGKPPPKKTTLAAPALGRVGKKRAPRDLRTAVYLAGLLVFSFFLFCFRRPFLEDEMRFCLATVQRGLNERTNAKWPGKTLQMPTSRLQMAEAKQHQFQAKERLDSSCPVAPFESHFVSGTVPLKN